MMVICLGKKVEKNRWRRRSLQNPRTGWTIRVLGELRAASRHRILGSRMEKVSRTDGR